jgi:hypothetical protein
VRRRRRRELCGAAAELAGYAAEYQAAAVLGNAGDDRAPHLARVP